MTNFDNWQTMNPSEYAAYNGIPNDNDSDSIIAENNTVDNELPCGCVPEDFCKCDII